MTPAVWRELGRDLGTLLAMELPANLTLDPPMKIAPAEELVAQRLADGWLTALDAEWLLRWLMALGTPRPTGGAPFRPVLSGRSPDGCRSARPPMCRGFFDEVVIMDAYAGPHATWSSEPVESLYPITLVTSVPKAVIT